MVKKYTRAEVDAILAASGQNLVVVLKAARKTMELNASAAQETITENERVIAEAQDCLMNAHRQLTSANTTLSLITSLE